MTFEDAEEDARIKAKFGGSGSWEVGRLRMKGSREKTLEGGSGGDLAD